MSFTKIEASLNINRESIALDALKEKYPSLMTAEELLELPIPAADWVVDYLLPAGLSLIGGAPKIGKSYFRLKLIKDIIGNGGKAFYMAGEDSNWLLQSRLKQLSLGGSDFIHHRGREAELAKPENYLCIIEDILSIQRFDAVFLDNMQMVLPSKPGRKDDYEYYYDHLPKWARLAEKYKCAIVMVHHARKDNGQAHPNPLQSILGSTVITGACDTILVIQKSDDGQAYTLNVMGKFTPDKTYSMTKQDGLFIIEGYEKEASLKRKAAQDAIYQCIKENPQIRQVEIAKKLNKHKSNISRDIKKLLRSGYIEELPGYRYSVLPPDNIDNLDN